VLDDPAAVPAPTVHAPIEIGIFGAGAIGTFLGVRCSSVGCPVTLVGRRSLVEAKDRLRIHGLDGRACVPGPDLIVTDDPTALADVDVCLVTVKSRDTEAAGRCLAGVLRPGAVVVSFQNGLRNPATLRAELAIGSRGRAPTVVAAMVSYNVLREGPSTLRQATGGPLVIGTGTGETGTRLRALAAALVLAGDVCRLRDDVDEVLAGKLLLNLNNGVCAVTGMTIAESLRSRVTRSCFAILMREGLAVMRAAELHPARVLALPPSWIARLLAWPDAIVLRAAKSLANVDPRAKSSTLQDLEAGKPTEIDDLSGEIVRLAERAGVAAPANRLLVELVHELERAERPLQFVTPEHLRMRIEAARP
jgi:2-dehydropantoate 2-reductase